MPECAFKSCKNNYRKSNVSVGVSYFRFPSNPFTSAEWISIVTRERKEEYKPAKNSVICSDHFDKMYISGNTNRRRLAKNAIPKLQIQHQSKDQQLKTPNAQLSDSDTDGEMQIDETYGVRESVKRAPLSYVSVLSPSGSSVSSPVVEELKEDQKNDNERKHKNLHIRPKLPHEQINDKKTVPQMPKVCRGCLCTSGTMVQLGGALASAFTAVSGVKMHNKRLPSSLCVECRAVLLKVAAFGARCRKANDALMHLLANRMLSISDINAIDRDKLGLSRYLTKKINTESDIINASHIELNPLLIDPIKEEYDTTIEIEKDVDMSSVSNLSNKCDEIKVEDGINSVNYFNANSDVNNAPKDLHNKAVKSAKGCVIECLSDKSQEQVKERKPKKRQAKIRGSIQKTAHLRKVKIKDDPADSDFDCISCDDSNDADFIQLPKDQMKTNKKITKVTKRKKDKTVMEESSNSTKKTYAELQKAAAIFRENFTIVKYDLKQQIEEFEKRKESKEYLQRPFKCDICYKGFKMEDVYQKHLVMHNEKTKYFCTICKLYLSNARLHTTHADQHARKYHCGSCDFVSNIRSSASLHVRCHGGARLCCPVAGCAREFVHYTSYANHVRVNHPSRHACAGCGYAFVGAQGLRAHELRAHKGIEIPADGPTCADCDIKFLNEEALQTHRAIAHKDSSNKDKVRNRKCINDRYKDAMQYYKPPVQAATKNVCEKCGESVARGQQRWHYRRAHPDCAPPRPAAAELCHLCGATFRSKIHLKYHMEVHNKTFSMKCDQCPKTFTNRFALYRHKHMHKYLGKQKAGVRIDCAQCGLTFSTYGNRSRHIRTVHSMERNFFCEFCSKSFKTKDEMKTHTEHVHFKKPWPRRQRGRRAPPETRSPGEQWRADTDTQPRDHDQ